MYPVITISREFGSGGHSIGEAVAKQLNIPFYDGEIVNRVPNLCENNEHLEAIKMAFSKSSKRGLKIIIVGCGKVGRTLVDRLSKEGHDIVIIDENQDRLDNLTNL